MLLESGGPLPQYHPCFLAALLLSGKRALAAAVLQHLEAWLAALQQHAQAAEADPTSQQPPSPGVHIAGGGSSAVATPLFSGDSYSPALFEHHLQRVCCQPPYAFDVAGLPLADLLDSRSMRLGQLLHAGSGFVLPDARARSAPAAPQQPAAGSMESGMLDLAAFGMAPAAPQQPAAASMESGMLDLAAFGMAPAPAAPAASACQQHAPLGGFPTPTAQLGSERHQGVVLATPLQQLVRSNELFPVASNCAQRLMELLVGASDARDAAGGGMHTTSSWEATVPTPQGSSHPAQQQSWRSAVSAAIPGLTSAETAEVLAISESFSAPLSSPSNIEDTGALDTAAAQFVVAVSLACATRRAEQFGNRAGSSSWPLQQQLATNPRAVVMNAAGVAYTLAPSAVANSQHAEQLHGCSIGQQWGLLPGLDAMAVLWGLLSGALPHPA